MVQITMRSESFQRREVRLAICLLPPFHRSPSTAAVPMALHHIPYVQSGSPLLLRAEGTRTHAPSHPPAAAMGRKTLRSPAQGCPILLLGRGRLWLGLCASVCVRGQSPGREEMLTPVTHLPSHSAGEPLAVLPFFSVVLLRKGRTLAPSSACLMPLLSVFPCYSSPDKGDGLALPSCHLDIRTQGLRGQNQCPTAILNLCRIKINQGGYPVAQSCGMELHSNESPGVELMDLVPYSSK